LLIEVDPAARFGLSDLLDLQEELAGFLDRPINFAFASEMHPWLLEWIEKTASGSTDGRQDGPPLPRAHPRGHRPDRQRRPRLLPGLRQRSNL
jgi:hypothetical protein